jgi:hypothetical protein
MQVNDIRVVFLLQNPRMQNVLRSSVLQYRDMTKMGRMSKKE